MNPRARWGIVGAVALISAGVGSCVVKIGDSSFYRPDSRVHGTPESHGLNAEPVRFRARNGPSLHGWWVPAVGESKGTVVYCHGNHANLTHHARFVKWLPARGYHVLLFDYRGFGKSEGEVTREGTVEDTVAAIDYALSRDPDRTIVFGHSLGGAVGIVAAAQRTAVRAVVAESSFPTYRAAAREVAPWLSWIIPLLVSEGFEPVDALEDLPPRPLLVIHGTDDHITPLELGESIYAAALEPKRWHPVEGARHATPWIHQGEAFEAVLCGFFAEALALPPYSPPR